MTQRRDVHGIVMLDKPAGITSNRALQKVKHLFRARKAGHTGALDPIATGLLPLCLGEATKVSGFLLDADKGYQVVARLGQTTETGDREGAILSEQPVPEFSDDAIQHALAGLLGEIDQVPPMYSALKHDGKRLYELARRGETVDRPARRVTISAFDLVERREKDLVLNVACSKGTYVRTLVEDLGKALGCGAHVAELRRTKVAPFEGIECYTLEQLTELAERGEQALDGVLIRPDQALVHLPAIHLPQDSAFYVTQGQGVVVSGAPSEGDLRLYGPDDHFLGIGLVLKDGRVGPKRLLHLPGANSEAAP